MGKKIAPTTAADRPVTNVMSQPVVAVHGGDTLSCGLQALTVADLHHIVVDGDRRPVGVRTAADFVALIASDHGLPVEEERTPTKTSGGGPKAPARHFL